MDGYQINSATGIAYLDYNPNGNITVLLLHGLGADGSSWGYQFPAMVTAGMRVLAVDMPGFGKSTPPEDRWTIKSVTIRIAQFLQDLKVNQAAVAGISMGGIVAQQLALDYPSFVGRLALVNTFASLRPRKLNEMLYMLTRFAIANLRGVSYQANLVAWRLFPQPEQAELRREMISRIIQANPKIYRQAMLALGLFNSRPRLRELAMPTLVISGAKDTTVSLVNQKALVAGISHARHVIIENAGHAIIIDQPDCFNQTLISFLEEAE